MVHRWYPTLVLSLRQNGDDSVHRRAEVAVGVLNAAVWTRGDGLIVCVEGGMEAAVVGEGTGLRKAEQQLSWFAAITVRAGKHLIDTLVTRRRERVIGHDCVI